MNRRGEKRLTPQQRCELEHEMHVEMEAGNKHFRKAQRIERILNRDNRLVADELLRKSS